MDIFRTLSEWLTPDPLLVVPIGPAMSDEEWDSRYAGLGRSLANSWATPEQLADWTASSYNSQQNAWPDILTGNAYLHPAEYRSAERNPYVWRSTAEFD